MSRLARIALCIFVASLGGSIGASFLLTSPTALWIGLPAIVLSAWAAIGHVVTIDDDAPGGWSNPDGSTQPWRRSLAGLALKVVVALIAVLVVAVGSMAQHGP